jgi:hypothetical protein
MTPSGPKDTGDVKFEAFDSRFLGAPLSGDDIIFGAPLWSLLVSSNGTPLDDKSNLTVQFALNPYAALQGAFLDTLSGPITPDNQAAFEAAVAAGVFAALTVANGDAMLTDYQLFAPTLMYNVFGSVTYASDAGAGLDHEYDAGGGSGGGSLTNPEPSTLTLLGLGTLGLLGYTWRRRRAA